MHSLKILCLFVFITFVMVMDLICNQLSLNGLGRGLFQMSSLKESVSVAVMVSRFPLKFCCCCLTVFHPFVSALRFSLNDLLICI